MEKINERMSSFFQTHKKEKIIAISIIMILFFSILAFTQGNKNKEIEIIDGPKIDLNSK